MKLELVLLPVTDVDRAKALLHRDSSGFTLDVDHQASDEFRVVQLTPPGSACSIIDRHRHHRRGRRARSAAPTWSSPTSRQRTPSWSERGVDGQRDPALRERRMDRRARPGARATTTRSPISPTPTATPGCCRSVGRASRRRDARSRRFADEAAFAALAERHRRELHVHCYRMLASFDEAEDAVQETFLRAWRAPRALRRRATRCARGSTGSPRTSASTCSGAGRGGCTELRSFAEVPWLQPYPDRLLDEIAPSDDEPDAVAVARETIELAFLAALQVLPPRQRAALLAPRRARHAGEPRRRRCWRPASPAANSALQRARATMQEHLPSHRADWSAPEPSAEERELLERFIDAHERCDAAAAVADRVDRTSGSRCRRTRCCFDGLDAMPPLLERAFGAEREGDWRLLPTMANRMPAAGELPAAAGRHASSARSSSTCCGSRRQLIAEITTFGPELFAEFGLPETL